MAKQTIIHSYRINYEWETENKKGFFGVCNVLETCSEKALKKFFKEHKGAEVLKMERS